MCKISLPALEASLNGSTLKVDRKASIVYGVKIIGHESDNNRVYTPAALKAACHLYENIKVNVDHPADPADPHSAYDRCGKLMNVRYVEGKGLFGDLWLIPSHRITNEVFDAAELMPDMFGLSHNAQGEGEKQGDTFVVSRVTEVRHVDLVADPATTKSLSEGLMKTLRTTLREEEDKKPMEGDDTPAATEEDEDEEGDSLAAKVLDALKESEDSDEDKAQKIVDLVKEALKENDDEGEDTTESEDEEAASESDDEASEDEEETRESRKHQVSAKLAALQEDLRSMRKESFIRRLCADSGLPLTKHLLEDLQGLSKVAIGRHVKRLALAHQQTKPRSGTPVLEAKAPRIPQGAARACGGAAQGIER